MGLDEIFLSPRESHVMILLVYKQKSNKGINSALKVHGVNWPKKSLRSGITIISKFRRCLAIFPLYFVGFI